MSLSFNLDNINTSDSDHEGDNEHLNTIVETETAGYGAKKKRISVAKENECSSKRSKQCLRVEQQSFKAGIDNASFENSLLGKSHEVFKTNIDTTSSNHDNFIETLYGKTKEQMRSCYEMGYFWLEKCHVTMHQMTKTGSVESSRKKWALVNVVYSEKTIKSHQESKENYRMNSVTTETMDAEIVSDADVCCFCRVNMYEDNAEPSNTYHIDLPEIESFDGNIDHVACLHCKKKRSDLSLLLGLLRFCQDIVLIKSCYVLVDMNNELTDLILTVTFPYWFLLDVTASGKRIILPSWMSSTRKKCNVLHPSTQCLLSLIQSDWTKLDHRMVQKVKYQHQDQETSKLPPITLFPSQLTLEEIYKSMRSNKTYGSNDFASQEQPKNERGLNYYRIHNILSLTLIPVDIWETHIGPFLRAKELYLIRCECKYLFGALARVVPGFKPSIHLNRHQVSSLLWMRRRERKLITERNCLDFVTPLYLLPDQYDCVVDDDYHRAVTGGRTSRLTIRKPSSLSKSSYSLQNPSSDIHGYSSENLTYMYEYIRLDQLTGKQVLSVTGSLASRQVASGGLLCDDPGLGKTITVLSLILQTWGLSTTHVEQGSALVANSSDNCNRNAKTSDDAIFNAYWEEQVTHSYRGPALLKLMNNLGKLNQTHVLNVNIKELKKNTEKEEDASDFDAFCKKVEVEIMESCNGEANCPDEKSILIKEFRDLVTAFIETHQLRSAKKSFSNSKSKPNSSVATLVEQEKRKELIGTLIHSSGTLLVIPSNLMDHWHTQIKEHVNFRYCTNRKLEPLIFEYHKGKYYKDMETSREKAVAYATDLCEGRRTHSPVVFLDKAGTQPLPPPKFLATFQVVITTTERFMTEWKKGSLQREIDRSKKGHKCLTSVYTKSECCPLLKVHWLRLVVDEGHSMGNSHCNSTVQFASWINAERRWAMSGTPTKEKDTQLRQIFNLLNFLQHQFFSGPRGDADWWKRCIVRSWKDRNAVSFFRLRSLLAFLMQRHSKTDIIEIFPIMKSTFVPMSCCEVTGYNTRAAAIQSNILLTSMKGKTSGEQDSLLHRSQAKIARLTLNNLRLACTGWTQVTCKLRPNTCQETLRYAKTFEIDETQIAKIGGYIDRTEKQNLSNCDCCGFRVSILLLKPCCGAIVCTECVDGSTSCILCGNEFDIDRFQEFQPGIQIDWLCTPTDSVESNGPDKILNEAGHIPHPITERRTTMKFGDGHCCQYDIFTADGHCVHCLTEHDNCNLTNKSGRCADCYRCSIACPNDESKSFYLVERLLALLKEQENSARVFGQDHAKQPSRPLKVIVFSQFRDALNARGNRLLKKFGTACVAEYFGVYKEKELHKFAHESHCFILLLTKDGSEGLDLSFVTNIVFLEPIYDKSLQNQAIARAWRMGATGPVEVETLIASKTVEEALYKQSLEEPYTEKVLAKTNLRTAENNARRVGELLWSLRLNTDHHHFGQGRIQTNQNYGQSNEKIVEHVIFKKPRNGRHRVQFKISLEEDITLNKSQSAKNSKHPAFLRKIVSETEESIETISDKNNEEEMITIGFFTRVKNHLDKDYFHEMALQMMIPTQLTQFKLLTQPITISEKRENVTCNVLKVLCKAHDREDLNNMIKNSYQIIPWNYIEIKEFDSLGDETKNIILLEHIKYHSLYENYIIPGFKKNETPMNYVASDWNISNETDSNSKRIKVVNNFCSKLIGDFMESHYLNAQGENIYVQVGPVVDSKREALVLQHNKSQAEALNKIILGDLLRHMTPDAAKKGLDIEKAKNQQCLSSTPWKPNSDS